MSLHLPSDSEEEVDCEETVVMFRPASLMNVKATKHMDFSQTQKSEPRKSFGPKKTYQLRIPHQLNFGAVAKYNYEPIIDELALLSPTD